MKPDRRARLWLHLGLTAVFIGYFSVWLPNEAAGLSFLGFEISEWVKFLPDVRNGTIGWSRDLFYFPPIALALILMALTAGWDNHQWSTWGQRALAVGTSLLALPSLEAVRFEGAGEWRTRLLLVGFVVVAAVVMPFAGRILVRRWRGIVAALALAGIWLPTATYLAVRPAVADALRAPVGIGPGVWLNAIGFLAVLIVALAPRAGPSPPR